MTNFDLGGKYAQNEPKNDQKPPKSIQKRSKTTKSIQKRPKTIQKNPKTNKTYDSFEIFEVLLKVFKNSSQSES